MLIKSGIFSQLNCNFLLFKEAYSTFAVLNDKLM